MTIPHLISNLWLPSSKSWDLHKVNLLFGTQLTNDTRSIPIISHNESDILCWTPSISGKCTAKEAYRYLDNMLHDPTALPGSKNLLSQALIISTTEDLVTQNFTTPLQDLCLAPPQVCSGHKRSSKPIIHSH